MKVFETRGSAADPDIPTLDGLPLSKACLHELYTRGLREVLPCLILDKLYKGTLQKLPQDSGDFNYFFWHVDDSVRVKGSALVDGDFYGKCAFVVRGGHAELVSAWAKDLRDESRQFVLGNDTYVTNLGIERVIDRIDAKTHGEAVAKRYRTALQNFGKYLIAQHRSLFHYCELKTSERVALYNGFEPPNSLTRDIVDVKNALNAANLFCFDGEEAPRDIAGVMELQTMKGDRRKSLEVQLKKFEGWLSERGIEPFAAFSKLPLAERKELAESFDNLKKPPEVFLSGLRIARLIPASRLAHPLR